MKIRKDRTHVAISAYRKRDRKTRLILKIGKFQAVNGAAEVFRGNAIGKHVLGY